MVLARRVKPLDRRASIAIHAALGTQILLGIATVMSGVALPLAALHQAVGALLVAAIAWGAHVVGRRRRERLLGLRRFPDVDEAMRIGRDRWSRSGSRPASTSSGRARRSTGGRATVEQSDETPALFKTTTERADALIERVAELHSYDVPAIVVWPVDRVLARYGEWVESEVR